VLAQIRNKNEVWDGTNHNKQRKSCVNTNQQQQQQHSLLFQASWGRLEMKPKRDKKQGDTNHKKQFFSMKGRGQKFGMGWHKTQ
jgi:hypothetical protein